MGYWLVGSLICALASLAGARYISGPGWVYALFSTGAFIGLALAVVCGLVVRRLFRGNPWWKAPASLVLALAAAVGRTMLLSQVAGDPAFMTTIAFGPITLACSTVVWGLVALLWGTLAVTDVFEHPGKKRGGWWWWFLAAGSGVSLALYSVAPLWYLLGVRINHLTLLGLFGLACLAYLVGRAYRWVKGRSDTA